MSRDQRPGRVRVFTSGQPAEIPHRRRGDVNAPDGDADGEAIAVGPAPQIAIATDAPKTLSAMVLAMLFVVGCGLGGMLFAALGLFEVPL